MRKTYIDNIRWATVLLVLAYHVFYIFNGVGVLGGIPNAKSIPVFDTVASLIYPWFMVLLFVVSGMSARYALDKRTGKQFIKERAIKLLVPSTLGLFVIHWVTGYLNIKIGGGLEFIPKPLIYPISVISGIGPLWFIQMLFLFSCILVLIRKIDKKDKIWVMCEKVNLPIIILLFVVVFLSAQILNMPMLTMYRFGIYFISFLIGYYVLSHEKVQEKIARARVLTLCLAVVCGIFYAIRFGKSNYTSAQCLQNILTNMYLWFTVLAVLGWSKRYFNQKTIFTDYMTKSSFGIYILHYPVLISVCYVLQTCFDFSPVWNYAASFISQIIITFMLYEVIKRIPGVKFFVLGKK